MKDINSNNTLLAKSAAPYGAPEFAKFKKEDYLPAFEAAIAEAKSNIVEIVDNIETPSFSNTIEALEYANLKLNGIEGIFFNLLEADSDKDMHTLAEQISPLLTEYNMYVILNKKLFCRIKEVYENRGNLTREQNKLLEDTYKSFVRNGAELSEEDKQILSKINEELALKELEFGNNALNATNEFKLHITDKSNLEGLPSFAIEEAALTASQLNETGWIFTLEFPSYSAFMKYSSKRELRREMYMLYSSRAIGGNYDNTHVIYDIVRLRIELAHILGYETYSDYAIEDRMAGTKANVLDFLDRLMKPSLPCSLKEINELYVFARNNGFDDNELMPWDFSYWAEKYRQLKYSIDEESLKPYFRLEACIDAVFDLAYRLYGIKFRLRTDIPVYHNDVRVYEVLDQDGSFLALFYADFFPRNSKRGGAWMTEFRSQYVFKGHDYRPFVNIVTNFTKPSSEGISLLTLDEFTTLLHEFGHALHGMLSKGHYPSLSGTSVARDFVELPSQMMENWAFEPEFLNTFALHYKTGEPIPDNMLKKIQESRNYLSGYYQVRQLRFAIIDMSLHTLKTIPELINIEEFENKALGKYDMLPQVKGTAICPSFGHIFSGGYSAGYYSYKWAEVLEADAFSLFKEKGIFNKQVAESFRKNILERGSSEDEAVLYRNFRGHNPEPEYLLKKLGIIV